MPVEKHRCDFRQRKDAAPATAGNDRRRPLFESGKPSGRIEVMSRIVIALAVVILAGTAGPVRAQQGSCLSEVERLASLLPDSGAGAPPAEAGQPPASAAVPSPSSGSVSSDLARSGGTVETGPIGSGITLEQQPRGAEAPPVGSGLAPAGRQRESLTDDERNRIRSLLQDARTSARQGDEAGCTRQLREARGAARQAGIGAPGG
jgi:hypothetical protein